MANLDMEKINAGIADRSDVFYWQTDRAVEPADAENWYKSNDVVTANQILDSVTIYTH